MPITNIGVEMQNEIRGIQMNICHREKTFQHVFQLFVQRDAEEHEMCFNISPFYKSNMKEWSISQEKTRARKKRGHRTRFGDGKT